MAGCSAAYRRVLFLTLAAATVTAAAGVAPGVRQGRRLADGADAQCNSLKPVPDLVALEEKHKCHSCSRTWAAARDTCHKVGGRESWGEVKKDARRIVNDSDAHHFADLHPLTEPALCDHNDYDFEFDPDLVSEQDSKDAQKWFKANVNVYVVNLQKDTERWERISKRLAKLGIPFQRIPGVDLTAPTAFRAARWEGLFPDSFNFTKAELKINSTTKGAGGITGTVGCAAAHLRTMRIVSRMVEAQKDPKAMALILEDDVRLSESFVIKLKSLLKNEAPCDWEVIALQSLCPYGACVSHHLSRVLPLGETRAARCTQGVNLGFSGMLYRASTLSSVRSRLSESVWDDEHPACLDIDVALASIADKVSYYAVPGALAKGLMDTDKHINSSRLAFNDNFAGWTAWSGGVSGGERFRSRSDQFWEVVSASPVNVMSQMSLKEDWATNVLSVKQPEAILRGLEQDGWVKLVSEPGFVKINDTAGNRQLRKAEPVYAFWNGARIDHTFHMGEAWLGEQPQELQFYAFPQIAKGTDAVNRFSYFYKGRLEYTFHLGEERDGEIKQGIEYYAFAYEAPGTEPVYEFWHSLNREYTLHMGKPWDGEEKRKVQFWAYPPRPEDRPKPEGVRDCMKLGVTYEPLGTMKVLEKGSRNATGCQELCKDTKDCRYFSFFPWDGSCHLAEHGASTQSGSPDIISGPRSCKNASSAPSSVELEHTQNFWQSREGILPDALQARPGLAVASGAVAGAGLVTALVLLNLRQRRRADVARPESLLMDQRTLVKSESVPELAELEELCSI